MVLRSKLRFSIENIALHPEVFSCIAAPLPFPCFEQASLVHSMSKALNSEIHYDILILKGFAILYLMIKLMASLVICSLRFERQAHYCYITDECCFFITWRACSTQMHRVYALPWINLAEITLRQNARWRCFYRHRSNNVAFKNQMPISILAQCRPILETFFRFFLDTKLEGTSRGFVLMSFVTVSEMWCDA